VRPRALTEPPLPTAVAAARGDRATALFAGHVVDVELDERHGSVPPVAAVARPAR
jgi:hypothetical protein